MIKKTIFLFILSLILCGNSYSQTGYTGQIPSIDQCLYISTEDGSVENPFCSKILVTDGTFTDNGDGTFSLNTGGGGGGGSNPIIQNNDVTNVTSASIIDFSSQFVVTEEPTNEANIVIGSNAITVSNVSFIGSATGNAGYIFVADGTDFESVAMSGDCTINSAGYVTCTGGSGATQLSELSDVGTATATTGNLLIADGSAFQGVALSGDITVGADGVTTIQPGVVDLASNVTGVLTAIHGGLGADFLSASNGVMVWSDTIDRALIGTSLGNLSPFLSDIGTITTGAGSILIADGTDYETRVVSGDATINLSGLLTIEPNAIGSSEIINNSITAGDLAETYLTTNETITISGDASGSGTTSISVSLATNSVSDNEIDYSQVTLGDFTNDANFTPNAYTGVAGASNELAFFDASGNIDGSGLIKGTFTDGRYCKYTSAGTLIDCNSTCEDITGSADLCDGVDNTAAGGAGDDTWINTTNVTTAKFTDNTYFDFAYETNAQTVQIYPVANSITAGLLFDTYLTAEVDGSTSNELQNLFNTVTVAGETPIIASSQTDTLELVPGLNMSITTVNGTVVFSSTDTDTDTQLTQEQVEDFVGNMLDGTETLITVDYDDINNSITFVVDNDLANYDNTNAGFLDTSTGISSLADVGSTSYGVGSLLVADGDSYEEVVMSGDATINASGVLTIDDSTITITESQISDLAHTTDTNANTICTGTTTYLDGEGNCDDISSVYESATSNDIDPDRLSGDTTDDNLIDDAIIASTIARDSELHDAATVSDTSEIDLTITGQQISGVLVAGSIDETKLDTSTNASLDLADSATQPGDGLSTLTNDAGYLNTSTVISALADVGATDYTAGQFLVADGNSFEQVAMSGDATLSASGVLTVANNSITAGMLQATNSPTDNYVPTFDLATGGVTWDVNGAGGGDSVTIDGASITDPDFRSDAQISFVDNSNTVVGYINPNAITANNLYDTGLFTREVQLTLVEQATNVTSTLGISNSFYAGNVLTGYDVTWGKAYVDTAGVTGSTTANLYNVRGSCYMFTGGLVIASGSTSSSAGTVNTSCDDINEGDEIRPDVTGVSSTAPTGLTIIFDAKKP